MSSIAAFEGSIPANYDRYLGPHLFEPYAMDLVERIESTKPIKVLELACGTGRVTHHLVGVLQNDGQLYATDLNPDMLQVAKQKIKDERIVWQVVDAQELPYEKERFDLVVCQFGVMFFPDRTKAFGEVYRVLKSGGRFIFNTWDDVQYNTASQVTQEVLNDFFKGDAPAFFQKGPFSFFNQEEIQQLLEETNFKKIAIAVVHKETSAVAADDLVNGFVDGSPLTGYLTERGVAKEEIKKQIKEALATKYGVQNLPLAMQAIVCDATK